MSAGLPNAEAVRKILADYEYVTPPHLRDCAVLADLIVAAFTPSSIQPNTAPQVPGSGASTGETREPLEPTEPAIASSPAALSATVPNEEKAWLIESIGGRWGTGYFWKGIAEYGTWGVIDEAVRFARKADAERVIETLHAEDARRYGYKQALKYEACEHIWHGSSDDTAKEG